jgi:uncharacterized protein YcfL
VASYDPYRYSRLVLEMRTEERDRQIAVHAHDLARIAMKKYSAVNNSIRMLIPIWDDYAAMSSGVASWARA